MYQTGYYATGYYQTGYYLPTFEERFPNDPRWTYEYLIFEARTMLGDDNELCYRWSDETLVSTMNRGLNELQRIRPDAWYDTNGVVPEVTSDFLTVGGLLSWKAPFGPDLRFWHAMVQYIVSMTQVQEDPFVDSGDVQRRYELFRTLVLNT
ncbi:MAG: hypothetical protein JSW51_05005 [Gemmatimonadota bacterium]|jgi:hypothetical protein|nr:MAG: hypothetical protein JSW51_05005 [Gemmatimonadota bacterium]